MNLKISTGWNDMNILKRINRFYLRRFKPIQYAAKVGVKFNLGGLFLYGTVSWSTEPWLITLGNNVHLTDGVKFITHDGGFGIS